jgi:uncharacterized protein with von Willebrand factor type A (vWA) domain
MDVVVAEGDAKFQVIAYSLAVLNVAPTAEAPTFDELFPKAFPTKNDATNKITPEIA